MSDDDTARYRTQAQECRRLAAAAANPVDRDLSQRLADDWLKLAQQNQPRN